MNTCCVFDGHCDTAVGMWIDRARIDRNKFAVSLERAKKLDGYAQFFAFCTAWMEDTAPYSEYFFSALDYFVKQANEHPEELMLCRNAKDIRTALDAHKTAALFAIEGGEAVDCDPGRLDEAYEKGVRMVSLVWNKPNSLAGSCLTGEGLTPKGRDFFRRAQALHMIVDVSHLSERGFWEIVSLAEAPIIASHSNSKAVCPHIRNLSDEQFRAICQLGGTAGLNLYGPFITQRTKPTFDDLRRHLDHFLEIGGAGHVALGGDLDGCDALPESFSGIDSYEALWMYLRQNGYSDEALQRLFFESLLGVVTRVLDERG